MQSGFYRTGLKFGFQHYEVDADIICIGKGMGGGLPLSGLVGKSEVMDLSLPGELSSTHSCNPLSCAGGNTVIKIMESDKFKKIIHNNSLLFTTLGNQLKDKFEFLKEKSNFIGMVGALVFDLGSKEESIKAANIFCEKVLEDGVLVIKTGREAVKLSPPLLINKRNIIKAFKTLEKILINIDSKFH
jgi:4-aminobutyrate aminotransferase-like enzyme